TERSLRAAPAESSAGLGFAHSGSPSSPRGTIARARVAPSSRGRPVAPRVARAPLSPGALARPAIDRSLSAARFSARDHSAESVSSSSVAGAGKPSGGRAKASSAAVTFSGEEVGERAAVWLDTDAGRGVTERVHDRSEELVRALGGRVVDVL